MADRLRAAAPAIFLTLTALALRGWDFGNPVIHVDEQYYLLVGSRMWDGAVPFVDLWDRKPIGLFLIYAVAAAGPGDGILSYQVMATLAAVVTALTVRACAIRVGASHRGAMVAGIAYLLWLSLLGGRGGQSPVFYNLPITYAALMCARLPAMSASGDRARMIRSGAVACMLGGIAIQIKYTAALEGAFIGLAHLWWLRRAGARPAALIGAAALWAGCGVAPTVLAVGSFALIGPMAFDAFWFANFSSIFLRPPYPLQEVAMRLLGIAAQLSPLAVCAWLGWRLRPRPIQPELATLYGWLVAALAGFMAIGTFFDHYALPLIAPLAVLAAPVLGRYPRAAVGTLCLAFLLLVAERVFTPNDAAGAHAVARVVAKNSRGACPYVFIGDTITYHLSNSCIPTPYAFPNLLAYSTEQGATGIDEAAEVRRILRARPPVIVTSDRQLAIWNAQSLSAVKRALAIGYRPVWRTPRSRWRTVVYLRRDLNYIR